MTATTTGKRLRENSITGVQCRADESGPHILPATVGCHPGQFLNPKTPLGVAVMKHFSGPHPANGDCRENHVKCSHCEFATAQSRKAIHKMTSHLVHRHPAVYATLDVDVGDGSDAVAATPMQQQPAAVVESFVAKAPERQGRMAKQRLEQPYAAEDTSVVQSDVTAARNDVDVHRPFTRAINEQHTHPPRTPDEKFDSVRGAPQLTSIPGPTKALHPLARNAEEHLCYTAAADRMVRLFATRLVPYGTMREERFEPLRGVVRDEAEMSALTAAAVRVELERFAESCHHHNVTISMDFTEAAPPAADATKPGLVTEQGASLSVAATCEGRSRLLLYGRRLLRWREPCDALAAEIVGVVEEAVAAFISVRAAAVAAGGEARPALSFVSNGEAAAARLACRVMGERHHGLSSFCFRALLDGVCRRIAAAELPRLETVLRATAAGDAALSVLLGLSGDRVVVEANGAAAEYMLMRRRRPLVEALRHAGDASRRDTLSIVDTVTVRGALATLQPLEEALRAIAAPGTNVGAACCALGTAMEQLNATQLEALHAYRFALCAPTVVSAAGLCAGVEYGELQELHQALVGAKVGNVALLVAGCTPFLFDAAGCGVRMPSWNCAAVSATVMAEVRRRLSEHCASCVDVERTWIDALPPHAKMRLACGDTEMLEQLPLCCGSCEGIDACVSANAQIVGTIFFDGCTETTKFVALRRYLSLLTALELLV